MQHWVKRTTCTCVSVVLLPSVPCLPACCLFSSDFLWVPPPPLQPATPGCAVVMSWLCSPAERDATQGVEPNLQPEPSCFIYFCSQNIENTINTFIKKSKKVSSISIYLWPKTRKKVLWLVKKSSDSAPFWYLHAVEWAFGCTKHWREQADTVIGSSVQSVLDPDRSKRPVLLPCHGPAVDVIGPLPSELLQRAAFFGKGLAKCRETDFLLNRCLAMYSALITNSQYIYFFLTFNMFFFFWSRPSQQTPGLHRTLSTSVFPPTQRLFLSNQCWKQGRFRLANLFTTEFMFDSWNVWLAPACEWVGIDKCGGSNNHHFYLVMFIV